MEGVAFEGQPVTDSNKRNWPKPNWTGATLPLTDAAEVIQQARRHF